MNHKHEEIEPFPLTHLADDFDITEAELADIADMFAAIAELNPDQGIR
jgi:hypothetical protein